MVSTHFVVLLFSFKAVYVLSAHWSYDGLHGEPGPAYWPTIEDSQCGAARQSPINIVTMDAITVPGSLTFEGYDFWKAFSGRPVSITNNGHSAQVTLEGNYILSGTDLPGKYKAEQFHFHWGKENWRGSEHALNGKTYSAELHIVHYNTDEYASLSEAISSKKPGAVGVVGVFLEASQQCNANLNAVIRGLAKVPFKGDVANMEPFSVSSLLPSDTKKFYRYEGSLTTPTCDEVVTWFVFEKPIPISCRQLNMFRSLYETTRDDSPAHYLIDNFRPLQPLNGRNVYVYSPDVQLQSLLQNIIWEDE